LQIIGGMFGIELSKGQLFENSSPFSDILKTSPLLLSTARSIFSFLANTLHPQTVWLPSFLCGVIPAAISPHIFRYYRIDESLHISSAAWIDQVESNDIVVFIDYFGFPTWYEYAKTIRERGAWIIEDACQAMLNDGFCEYSDFIIFSPRKFVGVPDGGILLVNRRFDLPRTTFPAPPANWWLMSTTASIRRSMFDVHGDDRSWFDIFQKTELSAPFEPFKMSDLTFSILNTSVNWSSIINRRKRNYLLLDSRLHNLAVFPELPPSTAPLGFPIRCNHRELLRNELFSRQIFPPVHWPINDIVPLEYHESRTLSGQILTLPCDQRYSDKDMLFMAESILSFGLDKLTL
jgi:dTDP-4-amino-4,6-dideoxygalactose transaminase